MKYVAFALSSIIILSGCKPSQIEIEEAVIKTLDEKPYIVADALKKHAAEEDRKRELENTKRLSKSKEALEQDGYSLILGNPDGDITVTAFKDYRCGYCKRGWNTLKSLIKKDKNVRVVIKEMPILGNQSMNAARYALASDKQGKYKEYYTALIEHRGGWDDETLFSLAKDLDINIEQLEKDAKSDEITDKIQSNLSLASSLGISGTPAFVINDNLFPGAISLRVFEESIQKARK